MSLLSSHEQSKEKNLRRISFDASDRADGDRKEFGEGTVAGIAENPGGTKGEVRENLARAWNGNEKGGASTG